MATAPTWPDDALPKQIHFDLDVEDLGAAVTAAEQLGAVAAEFLPHPRRAGSCSTPPATRSASRRASRNSKPIPDLGRSEGDSLQQPSYHLAMPPRLPLWTPATRSSRCGRGIVDRYGGAENSQDCRTSCARWPTILVRRDRRRGRCRALRLGNAHARERELAYLTASVVNSCHY